MINEDSDLPDDIFAKLPGSSAVLNHAVSVDTDRWKRALGARGLPPAQGKLAGSGTISVTRKEVFDLGDQVLTVENAFQLFYYSLAWGLGTRAPRLHQRLDGLAADPEKAGKLLLAAWTLVRDGAPACDAYGTLTTNRGAGRIPWFGPAFSTKFLYFAQGSVANPKHIILDQVVSKNLRLDAWPQAPTAGWWPETYERYCGLLGRWADQAGERLHGARRVRADEIELTLFRRHLPIT
ncbi:hypothetical protein NG701_01165 [Pseudarthrobacter sp. HLT3-5]|uniref:8-oxoguanine DNA glycosylase OGG fold protein n=1 Tax=Pseudarthrobacter cellobiosi TaxID=2953654 RepID=UPI00208FC396|nr:hypothetical protein [Pseudarthrobacter sp. HLT3-5]MCO4273055.1 hypothetical protein [Pseudarthrobacter sp. HLT3-5]